MARKLEAIRGGGGSIKVGTTGTISALMSRELESTKSASFSAPNGNETSRRSKPATSADEASSSSSATGSFKCPENPRRKHHTGGTPQNLMLEANNTSVDGTTIRKKAAKKGHGIVEIVDIKCRVNPLTHRLKKLSFSKLSDSSNV